MEEELCPICIKNIPIYFTECNHKYCITCLCKIKKCAMCRKSLYRNNLCNEIKEKVKLFDSIHKNTNTNINTKTWFLDPTLPIGSNFTRVDQGPNIQMALQLQANIRRENRMRENSGISLFAQYMQDLLDGY